MTDHGLYAALDLRGGTVVLYSRFPVVNGQTLDALLPKPVCEFRLFLPNRE